MQKAEKMLLLQRTAVMLVNRCCSLRERVEKRKETKCTEMAEKLFLFHPLHFDKHS